MHFSSYVKAQTFLAVYGNDLPRSDGRIRVLEIGSKIHLGQDTYRELFSAPTYAYIGLDIEPGPNVDIVPTKEFVWDEVADCSNDLCISGQTFEHNPYFWITFAEMARILTPGGLAFVVAPGSGHVHRYPLDCWRFYPDSWAALCALTGMELLECYFEDDQLASRVVGGAWRDSAVVARKPLMSAGALGAYHQRLASIVRLFHDENVKVPVRGSEGPWVRAYRAEMDARAPVTWRTRLRRRRMGRLFRPDSN